jgi:hypothetical protein
LVHPTSLVSFFFLSAVSNRKYLGAGVSFPFGIRKNDRDVFQNETKFFGTNETLT